MPTNPTRDTPTVREDELRERMATWRYRLHGPMSAGERLELIADLDRVLAALDAACECACHDEAEDMPWCDDHQRADPCELCGSPRLLPATPDSEPSAGRCPDCRRVIPKMHEGHRHAKDCPRYSSADTERLDLWEIIEDEAWTIQAVDEYDSLAGDGDVRWDVIQYHMAEPRERVVGTGRTPKAAVLNAIDAARGAEPSTQPEQPGARTGEEDADG